MDRMNQGSDQPVLTWRSLRETTHVALPSPHYILGSALPLDFHLAAFTLASAVSVGYSPGRIAQDVGLLTLVGMRCGQRPPVDTGEEALHAGAVHEVG